MTKQYDVVIAGGGMVGMSMAIALAREGLAIGVIEKDLLPSQLEANFDGRVSAIALGSSRILDNIGVWEGMKPYAEPIRDIRVSDGDTPFFLHYDHHEVGDDPFGYIVENRYIRHALHSVGEKFSNLTIFDQTSISEFKEDGQRILVSLQGRQGNDITCRLLIGADGKHSVIRRLSGIGVTHWDYKQTAIVCTIAHEKSHNGLAQERFLPTGPFAVLPMQHNRSSLVWVEPDDRVDIYLQLPDEEFVQEIKERVGDYLGDIRVEGKRFSYPLSLMHAKTYVGKRLALIGDAAHGIHPIAGQGVNLGFRDIAVLAELIVEPFKLGMDIGAEDVLAHYQRWRRLDNVTMLAATDGMNRLFSNRVIPIQLARGFGLWAVGKMPPLKRFFMKHAMGLTGDQPILARKVTK